MDHPPSIHKRAESAASGYSESLNNSSVELEVRFPGIIPRNVRALIEYYSHVFQERILNDEFDELMRSGATMKVSLTPDRLKTMEVSHSPWCDDPFLIPVLGLQGRKKPPCGTQDREQTWD